MLQRIILFIESHHRLSIVALIFLCVTGVAYAANPNLPQYFFSIKTEVTSTDNSELISANLDDMKRSLKINSVREYKSNFRVNYSHDTYSLDKGKWSKVNVDKTLVISKQFVAKEGLGTYVAQKLNEELDQEIANLKQIQSNELGKGVTPKIVTTTYGGVVGGFIAPQTEVTPPASATISQFYTSTSTPPALDEEEIVEIVEELLEQSENDDPLLTLPEEEPSDPDSPSDPDAPDDPSGETSDPDTNPTPNPLSPPPPLPIPVPTPNPSPTPNTTPEGYFPVPYPYFEQAPDVVNTGPVPE